MVRSPVRPPPPRMLNGALGGDSMDFFQANFGPSFTIDKGMELQFGPDRPVANTKGKGGDEMILNSHEI